MFDNAFLKTLNILYIESDENTNKHFFNILNKMFNKVNSFTNPTEAINHIKDNETIKEDIVICDLYLNSISGIEILKQIKLKDENKPFILTSNDVDSDEIIEAIKLNVDDFLLKPVNAKDLIFTVEKICNNKFHEKLDTQTNKDLKEIEEIINDVALVSKTNAKGEITFVNNYFIKTSKYTQEELLNNTHMLFKQNTTSIYNEIDDALANNKKWEGKLKEIDKDKKEFFSYLTILPIIENSEFMWIRFLATDYEEEQNDFRKKVKRNINESRRINNEARDKIDELQNRILYYNGLDESLSHETKRDAKFTKQLNYYKSEIKELEEKLEAVTAKATTKIKSVVELEKITREKRDETVSQLTELTTNFDIKNKTIKELTAELDKQKKIIERLKLKIDNREYQLGLND